MARTVTFRAAYWSFVEDEDDNRFDIHVCGQTASGETVYVTVLDYRPYVLLELPARVAWTKAKLKTLYGYLQAVLRPIELGRYKDSATYYTHLAKLHYRTPAKFLQLELPTYSAGRRLKYKCEHRMSIAGLGSFGPNEFAVHEHNIDPIVKYTATARGGALPLAGWLTARETVRADETGLDLEARRYATTDLDLYCDWEDLRAAAAPPAATPLPTYLSFDIECHSENPNTKLPDPEIQENVVFQIACVSGRVGCAPAERTTTLLTLYDPGDLGDGVTAVRCATEKELLLGFTRLVAATDPDLFLGYNILAFDWNYLLVRAQVCNVAQRFKMLGRLQGVPAAVRHTDWSSGAYGEQRFAFVEAQGRLSVDLLVEIKREYKLSTYSLNTVAREFLGQQKDDISARQLFMLYELTRELGGPDGLAARATSANIDTLRAVVRRVMVRRFSRSPAVKALRKALLRAKPEEVAPTLRRALQLTGRYCIKDTVLPIELFERLNLWEAMVASANCMCIPIAYLHTRGQQIRVLSQVYREAIKRGDLMIPFTPRGDAEKYQGAEVVEAVPGLYENVVLLDFASLYPTIVIAYNVDYTTIRRDDDPVPDADCHVLAWEDHVGCPHDPKQRKRKKSDVLCQSRRYRFQRVRVHADGTREHEGVLPAIVRQLLHERAGLKKKLKEAKARLAMDAGRASPNDRQAYAKKGWEVIAPGSLSAEARAALAVRVVVLDARQKATKVSANSIYGGMGFLQGYIPLLAGAESVTAMGRRLILSVIDHIGACYYEARLVYGDTDSCLFAVDAPLERAFAFAHESAKRATHHVKAQILGVPDDYAATDCVTGVTARLDAFEYGELRLAEADAHVKRAYDATPIELEFEDIFKDYLLLTKKRYAGRVVDRAGRLAPELTKKGIVLARRDNCLFLKTLYQKLVEAVLQKRPETAVHALLFDGVGELFTRRVHHSQLVITIAVKSLLSYAKHAPGRDDLFVDAAGDPIEGVDDPLDPRLVYPNLRQVQLALRMLRRGTRVAPGTRLEYVYVSNDDATHEGDRIEEYEHFCEYKGDECLELDYCHYVEKQLLAPITELLTVAFPHERIRYAAFKPEIEAGVAALTGYQAHVVATKSRFAAAKDRVVRQAACIAESARRYRYFTRAGGGRPLAAVEVAVGADDDKGAADDDKGAAGDEAPRRRCSGGLAECRCPEMYKGAGSNDIHGRDAPLGALCEKYMAFRLVNALRKKHGLKALQERRCRKKVKEPDYVRDADVVAQMLAARRQHAEVVKELNLKHLKRRFGLE